MYTAVKAASIRIKALSSMGQHLAVPRAAGNAIKRRGPERLAAACSAEFVSTPSGQSLTLGPFRRFQGGEQSFADARVNGKVAPTAVILSEFKAEAPAAADSTVCPDSMQARDGSVDVSNGSSDRRSRFGLVAHLGIQAINRSGRRSSKRHCPAS
jgi:hypothetical protein